MIRFHCPCGRELQAPEGDAGREARCPACDAISVVPAPPAEAGIRAELPDRPRRSDRREDGVDRPRRRPDREPAASGTSGKAITALVLGITSPFLLLPSVPGAIFGILALRDIGRSKGRLGGNGMAIAGIVLSCLSVLLVCPLALLLPAVQKVRTAAQRMQDANNLKQMGLAVHAFASANNDAIPQAAAYQDADGKPLLSWRVALLPYLEQEQLYKRFRLNEPWDSPNNKALLPLMPKVYGPPGAKPGDPNLTSGMTHYQVFVGRGTIFEPFQSKGAPVCFGKYRIGNIPDGTSNTVLIASSETPVPWTKPEDMAFDPVGPLPRLGGHLGGAANVLLADGSVRGLYNVSDATLRMAIICDDGARLPSDW